MVAKLAFEAGGTTVELVAVPGEFPDGWDLADDPPDGGTVDQTRAVGGGAGMGPGPSHGVPKGASPRRMIRAMRDLAEATEAALAVLGDDRTR